MIRPASDIFSYTIPIEGETITLAHKRPFPGQYVSESTTAERIVFSCTKRHYGIILVTAYQAPRSNQAAKCECVIADAVHVRWYRHHVKTRRQATLLVNRFLADLEKEGIA